MLDRSLRPLLLAPQQGPRLVRAALRLGDTGAARRAAGHAATIGGRTGTALWTGIARHAGALVDGDPAALRAAVADLRTTPARPALADALLDLARLPGVPVAEALDAAREAAAVYGRVGATGDQDLAQRCERRLRGGARRGAGGGRVRRPAHGLGALTAGERRVAELLAGGATKQHVAAQLFVSFHTVDTHLRAVYAKLGIHTRAELARIWHAPVAG
jgi:DNA-binding CsgD family transcriptional regulator